MTNREIIRAILKINPNAEVNVGDNSLDEITWLNGTTPISKADIEAKMNKIGTESNYAQQRRNAYPPIGDQLDMLWHTIDKDITLQKRYFEFYQAIQSVKVKYPK